MVGALVFSSMLALALATSVPYTILDASVDRASTSSKTVPYSSCALGDLVPYQVLVDESSIQAGDFTSFELRGTLADRVEQGTYNVQIVSSDGDVVSSLSGSICELVGCPKDIGEFRTRVQVRAPLFVSAGKYLVRFTLKNRGRLILSCIEFPIEIRSPFRNFLASSRTRFNQCGLGDLVPSQVSIEDSTPQIGSVTTIELRGTLAYRISEGSYLVEILNQGSVVSSRTGSICELVECPLDIGDVRISYELAIPRYASAGDYTVRMTLRNAARYILSCVEVPLTIASELPGATHSFRMISSVNSAKSTWTAGFSSRFWGEHINHVQRLCGSRRGGPVLPQKRLSSPFISAVEIPESFDSREQWGQICPTLHEVRDQGDCGSCWAVAAAAAISDRTCILSKGKSNVRLSAEELVSCCDLFTCGNGCNGGYPSGAWSYWTDNGIVTGGPYGSKQGCYPYEVAPCSHHVNGTLPQCSASESGTPSCRSTCIDGSAFSAAKHFGRNSYSVSSDPADIQKEILQNGPVEATFTVYEDFVSYKSGVYQHVSGSELGGHAVKMIGWGVENGTPYWLIANSWNDTWGDKGLFKILRGSDECGIESGIVAGTL
jgi:cathepsin B